MMSGSYLISAAVGATEFTPKQGLERAGHISDTDPDTHNRNNCNATPAYLYNKEPQRKRWSLFMVQTKVPACHCSNNTLSAAADSRNGSPVTANNVKVELRKNSSTQNRKRRQCQSMVVAVSDTDDRKELLSTPTLGKHTKRLSNGKLTMSNGLSLLTSLIARNKENHSQVGLLNCIF